MRTSPGPLLCASLACVLLAVMSTEALEAPPPSVTPASVPAAGRHHAIVSVAAFGRYAVTATSRQGVSLQLTDRMAGPGPVRGRPGDEDGRLDAFLDRGMYRLGVEGHPAASGDAALAVRAFVELSTPRPPMLVEQKLVTTALGDVEQRSYWLSVASERWVALEAAGRHLADLRLWRDGMWLVDAEPEREVVEPRRGKPLLACRLAVRLEPGLYLLTAYGGPGQPWAEGSEARPLYLRWGFPTLPEAARQRLEVGPFGADRFLVPRSATFFRLELPEARDAELAVAAFDEQTPFVEPSSTDTIDTRTVPPVAELEVAPDGGSWLVTVRAEEGQPYVLQHFVKRWEYVFRSSGPYWISSVHAGAPQDSVDATAIVQRRQLGQPPDREAYALDVVELGPGRGLVRRCNLLEEMTLFVRVAAAGAYEVASRGAEARFRFEPFLTTRPEHYEPPPFRPAGRWDLDAGLYVLTVRPEKQGVLDLLLRDVAAVGFGLAQLEGQGTARSNVQGAVTFPRLELDSACEYTVFLNHQPGVSAGLVVRPLPLDLVQALPLVLQPGEQVEAPIACARPGVVAAVAEDGTSLDVRLDGGGWATTLPVSEGAHTVAVRNPRAATAVAALRLVPDELRPEVPLPALPDATLAALPQYPVLQQGAPVFFDLGRGSSRTFLVRVDTAGLYRLESSGLLATSGTVRSRVVTSLDSQESNGVGRNFLIQQYLREGDYQLTVRTEGRSAGHLGVALTPTPLRDGGDLVQGIPARVSLGDGEGVSYAFAIPDRAPYSLRTLGLGQRFACRLEAAGGWPVVPPGGPADLSQELDPGNYRFVLLPSPVSTRRVTLLARAEVPLRFAGHGPHALPLDREVEHLWLEPEGDQPRVPDVWQVELPAAARLRVELGAEMQADIVGDGAAEPAAQVRPGKPLETELPAGRYELRVTSPRPNNRVPYTLKVTSDELLAGLSRVVTAPATVAVSVGGGRLVEVGSYGSADVRAELRDRDGTLLAASDDRPDDWSFLLAAQLPAGRYALRVLPVGADSATCTVSVRELGNEEERPLSAGERREVATGHASHLVPLAGLGQGGLVVVTATSRETVGLELESGRNGAWQSIGRTAGLQARLVAAVPSAEELRLRIWSADQRGLPVVVEVVEVTPAVEPEAGLAEGITLTPARGVVPALGVAGVRVDRGGLLRLDGEGLAWIAGPGRVAAGEPNGLASAAPPVLWVVGPTGTRVRGGRALLEAGGEERALTVQPGARVRLDLAKGEAGLWLVRAQAPSGQPLLQLVGGQDAAGRVDRTVAVAAREALAAWVGAKAPVAVEVWDGERRERPLEVRMRALRLPSPSPVALEKVLDGELQAGQALTAALPAATSRLRLTLADGVAAVLVGAGGITGVHWGPESVAEWVPRAEGTLVLGRLPSGAGTYAVQALPSGEAFRLDPASRLVVHEAAAGTLRLDVPTLAGQRLQLRGVAGPATLVGADGTLQRGTALDLGAGGSLSVPHGSDRAVLWVESQAGDASGLWGTGAAIAPLEVTPPALVVLGGPEVALAVHGAERRLVHLRTASPLLCRVATPAGATVEMHPEGLVQDVVAGPGPLEVGLRTLDGQPLEGELEVTTSPLPFLGEGLGPEVLLGPGQTRGFAFRVTVAGSVGLGVRAQRDVVEGTLYDAGGRSLGSGVVLMARLDPGEYVWALHTPVDGGPVRARPAVVGLVAPGSGPPEEVIRRYLRAARGEEEPPGASPTIESEDEEPIEDETEEPGDGEEPPPGEGR